MPGKRFNPSSIYSFAFSISPSFKYITPINPYTSDTLDISLGRDKEIVVTRIKLTDFTKTQTVGNNIKKTFAYEVTARNKKNEAVTLVIEDQLPVSSNKDISIDMEEAEGAKYNKFTGQLTWELSIPPVSSSKIKYIFSVKYPKEHRIYNL